VVEEANGLHAQRVPALKLVFQVRTKDSLLTVTVGIWLRKTAEQPPMEPAVHAG
jgi:hypothetical protein